MAAVNCRCPARNIRIFETNGSLCLATPSPGGSITCEVAKRPWRLQVVGGIQEIRVHLLPFNDLNTFSVIRQKYDFFQILQINDVILTLYFKK